MGSYIPATGEERKAMLASLGLTSEEELFRVVPEKVRVHELNLPHGLSEMETARKVSALAEKNVRFRSVFRGAGAYRHYIPSIVKTVTSKEDFVTAYTPYQAEISQGVLQSIFEYQTQICELTGMDVSNASVYDGAVAAAEAVLMCLERRKNGVILAGTVDPQVREVVQTYCESRNVPAVRILERLGVETGIRYLRQLGLPAEESDRTLALALGGLSNGYTPRELAGAYAALAGGGIYAPLRFIDKIEGPNGELLYRRQDARTRALTRSNSPPPILESAGASPPMYLESTSICSTGTCNTSPSL